MKLHWRFCAHHPMKKGRPFNEYVIWPGPEEECIFPSLGRLKEICSQTLGDKFLAVKSEGNMILIRTTVGGLTGKEGEKLTELTRIIGKETKKV